ncbi:bifunctional oligoribonuclease/PAP phosphatase NrnA [Micromonospora sp. NPDC001898]|uniref:DHH family phosphoesterase n=1 Tax=Micromonospora sp. NPDC001898 TaxID=3364221 RepID=UPI00367AE1A0
MTADSKRRKPGEGDWTSVVEVLIQAERVSLAAHINPDGDSLGSAIALGLALRALGKDVCVSFGNDPSIVPTSLSFLPALELVVSPADFPERPEVLVVLDTASRDRMGSLANRIDTAKAVIIIDHHATNPGFGTYSLIDSEAEATAAITEELLTRLGVDLTRDIATALYAGIASDTGSFKYPNTTSKTHRLAAKLLDAGVQQDVVGRHLWDMASVGYLKLLSVVLADARLEADAAGGLGIIWTTVRRNDRDRFGVAMDATEGIIDIVRKAREAEVTIVFREDDKGLYQVSLRSNGRLDVGAVCTALNGGGHRLAAGFTAHAGQERALMRLRQLLEGFEKA